MSSSSSYSGRISGSSGKSGSSSSSFIQTPNSLRSTSQLRVLAVISAGPIEGLAAGASSLRVDGVPVIAPHDGSTNIGGISWTATTGDDSQSRPEHHGFNAVEQTQPVGINLRHANPYTRTGQGDEARLTLRFPRGLVRQTDNGIFGSSVQIAIDARQPDGRFLRVAAPIIAEKQTAFFELQFTVSFSLDYNQGVSPAVRLTRLTPSSGDDDIRDDVHWTSITWVNHDQLSYAGLSTLALTIDSAAFNSLPKIELDVKGRQLRVPNNYNPKTRGYRGIWGGGFKLAYCNNPAWVVFDLLTDRNWGLGLSDQVIEIYDLYAIARYCDESVGDGRNGQEPRFTFDAVLSRRQSAYALIQQICAGVRAMMFWSGGRLRFIQDKPQDAVMWLTNHHVEDGLFIYTTSGSRTQYSHALVSFQDPDNPAQTMVEAETRPDVLAKTGYAAKEVSLLGCKRRSQARRHARWLLDKADASLHGISWRAGLDHFAANPLRPGDVVRVVDNKRLASEQYAGRLATTSTSAVLFSKILTITSGFADYETENGGWQVNHPVNITDADNGVLVTPQTPWPHPPVDQGAMVIKSARSVSSGQDYRIVALRELDRNRVEVDAIRHDNRRFRAIEQGLTIPQEASSGRPDFSTPIPAPTGLQTHQPAEVAGREALRNLVVAWTPPIDHRIAHWRVDAEGPDGEKARAIAAASPVVLEDLATGTWDLSVRAVDWAGNDGLALKGTATVALDPIRAMPPKGAKLIAGFGQLVVEWDTSEMPQGAVVEVLEYRSRTATTPKLVATSSAPVVLVGRAAGVMSFFRLRMRLRGGSLSSVTSLLSGAALALPQDGRDGATGQDGQDGTVIAHAEISRARWSDAAARRAVVALRQSGAIKGDLVTLSFAPSSWAETRNYDGTSWVATTAVLTGEVLASGTIPASKLKLDDSKLAQANDKLTIKAVPADLISSGVLRSSNYQKGLRGFSIDTNGRAEFNDTIVRGVLESSRIEGSTLQGSTLVAATSLIPTENQDGFFTLEQPRTLGIGWRDVIGRKLRVGPFNILRGRHNRRFGDGGRVMLAANNPFNGRDDNGIAQISPAGAPNSYYTRFWSDTPSIVLDMSYDDDSPSGGIFINSGQIQVAIKTSGGRSLASSRVFDLFSRPFFPFYITEGFAGASSMQIIKHTKGGQKTDRVRQFRLYMDLSTQFLHDPSDGEEDGLIVEIDLNIGSVSQTVLDAFELSVTIDASSQS